MCKLSLADCLEADWSFPGWTTGRWESGRTTACSAALQSPAAGLIGPHLFCHRHACLYKCLQTNLETKPMLRFHACFRLCLFNAPPPFAAHTPPPTPPPTGANPHSPTQVTSISITRSCKALCQMLKLEEGDTANLCPAPPLMPPRSPSTYKLTLQNLPCLFCLVYAKVSTCSC